MTPDVSNIVKIITPLAVAFFIGMALTPIVTHYLYKHKAWKKTSRKEGLGGGGTPIFNSLHAEAEQKTPRMGGIVIWGTILLTTLLFFVLSLLFPGTFWQKMNFLSNNQTVLPLFALIAAAIVGLVDDILTVSSKGSYKGGGVSLSKRLLIVGLIGLVGAWWFFVKLEVSTLFIPFIGDIELGWMFIPFFIFTMISLFASGVIDGLDGLAGGVLATIFAAYAAIAFFSNQIDLAAFNAVVAGAILVFLWFNIPPARFYMGETGILALTVTLSVVAFLSDAVFVLPIIAFPLVATILSVVIQVASKKIRGKKVFLAAPIHHHFEAIGWPSYKVTMRYWVIGSIFAILGIVIHFAGIVV